MDHQSSQLDQFTIFTFSQKVDFCTGLQGQLLTTPRIGGAGKVNRTSENGPFGPTVRVGGTQEEAQATVERTWHM